MRIHKCNDLRGLQPSDVVVPHGGVTVLETVCGYSPAVGTGKIALEHVVSGVCDEQLP